MRKAFDEKTKNNSLWFKADIISDTFLLLSVVIMITQGTIIRLKFVLVTFWNLSERFSSQGGLNSLAPGKFKWKFRHVIFKPILVIDGWGISCEISPIWMSLDFTDDQSTLVQVMAWCRQATSHYLSQCWPRYLSPYGAPRPQWVKEINIFHKDQNEVNVC